jgi:hypothetical protein
MKIKILTAALLALTFACDNDDSSPKETSLLTLTVETSYISDEADDWLIVHSENGTLLASEHFENNQELEIVTEKPVSGTITITHLQYIPDAAYDYYYLKSYTDIETGKHLVLKGPSSPPSVTGKINVSVSDVNDYQYYTSSSRVSAGSSGGWDSGTEILEMQSDAYSGVTKQLVTVSNANVLKYKMLEDVQPDETYSFSFNDMAPYDQLVSFSYPSANNISLFVWGSEPDPTLTPNSYLLTMRHLSNATTGIQAGYINSLTNFKTDLTLYYPGYSYNYLNVGAVPDPEIAWPQTSDFTIAEESLSNFSVGASASHVWRVSRWNHEDGVNKTFVSWTVASPSGTQHFNALPTDITSIHPALSLDDLEYDGTTFYTESPAYQLFFSNKFQAAPEPTGSRVGININKQ